MLIDRRSAFMFCLALAAVACGSPRDQASRSLDARRLWEGHVDVEGTVSADGRFLSYVDWSTGDLALRDLEGGVSRRLTHKGSWEESDAFAGPSAVSRDGHRVAYTWWSGEGCCYDLRVVGTDGSNQRVFYRDAGVSFYQPRDWSPDGEQVLSIFSRRDGIQQLALVSVADGSPRILKTLGRRIPRRASFSPDGEYVVYEYPPDEDAPGDDIFLLSADGGQETHAVSHPAYDYGPTWSPDGERVVFLSDRTGTWDVWAVRIMNGEPQGDPELVYRDVGAITPMGVSRLGAYYFAAFSAVRKVYVATLDPRTGAITTPPAAVTEPWESVYSGPAWSPDGRSIAYVSVRGGPYGYKVIAIRSADGEERRILVRKHPSSGRHAQPIWSPDGRSLLVPGCRGFCRIDIESGDWTRIERPGDEEGEQPVWSRDGRQIFFLTRLRRSQGSVKALDLETGMEEELYRGSVHRLALSPDGKRLAFVEVLDPGGPTALKVMPASGGAPREVIRLNGADPMPDRAGIDWSADGRHLLYARRSEAGDDFLLELWRVDAESGEAEKLGLGMEGLGRHGIDLQPDGQRIAFVAGVASIGIWVADDLLKQHRW